MPQRKINLSSFLWDFQIKPDIILYFKIEMYLSKYSVDEMRQISEKMDEVIIHNMKNFVAQRSLHVCLFNTDGPGN